jgi:hypothetical protein
LKLLGSLLATIADEEVQFNYLQLAQIKDLLISISSIDKIPQCRELAEKYLQVLG